jgi:hypothetical protein
MTNEEKRQKIEQTLRQARSHEEDMRLSLELARAQVTCLEAELKRMDGTSPSLPLDTQPPRR